MFHRSRFTVDSVFPKPVRRLNKAELGIRGATAWLSQSERHQILFMQFDEDVELPEHSHDSQWGVVIKGQIELVVGGERRVFSKGETYFIPSGVVHSAKVLAGYADITFFDSPSRYKVAD